jgi:hypothetical protein
MQYGSSTTAPQEWKAIKVSIAPGPAPTGMRL